MSSPLNKNKKLKSRIKNKNREWKYLKESKKDFDELFSIYEGELNQIISELSQYNSLTSPNNADSSEDVKIDARSSYREDGLYEAPNKIPDDAPKWVKKLYKKIAIETHPDKLSNSDLTEKEIKSREEIFKKSGELIKNGNFEGLLSFAEDLDLEVEIDDESYLFIVEKSIKELKEEFDSRKILVPWIWGNLEEQANKKADFIIYVRNQLGEKVIPKEVIESYINHFEKNELEKWKLENLNKNKLKINRKHPGKSIGQLRKENK